MATVNQLRDSIEALTGKRPRSTNAEYLADRLGELQKGAPLSVWMPRDVRNAMEELRMVVSDDDNRMSVSELVRRGLAELARRSGQDALAARLIGERFMEIDNG